MKKILTLTAVAAAAMLTSCTSDEIAQTEETEDIPVAFEPYTVRTRANDAIDTEALKTRGFGVFAYHQGTLSFNQYFTTSSEPNFMKNELVTYQEASESWVYSPVKYWSNNLDDKHSFFAYAPYYLPDGIHKTLGHNYPASLSLVLEGTNDGPAIYYVAPDNLDKVVDLCWGEYKDGKAVIDRVKPDVNDKMKFTFKHGLARINFNAQIWTDEVRGDYTHPTEGTPNWLLNEGTTITIKSIKLIGKMGTNGYLRLYDGNWNATYVSNKQVEMGDFFKKGINSCPCAYVLDNVKGEQELFGSAGDYYTVIPGSEYRIQIVYDVVTTDAKLDGGNSTVTNTYVTEQSYKMEAGKAYSFHLNIGMTSIKFEAEVNDWNLIPEYEEIDVPGNKL